MLEIRQNELKFYEVTQGENVLYTCLKQEDAESYQERHQNDPVQNQKKMSAERFNSYCRQGNHRFSLIPRRDNWNDVRVITPNRYEFWTYYPGERIYVLEKEEER